MGTVNDADALAARVDRLEQLDRIRALKHRYLRACDSKDVTAMRACFVDGPADLDYGPLGTFDDASALVDTFRRLALERGEDGYRILDMHHAVHDDIELEDADTARGHWTLRLRQIDRARRTETVAAVEYTDHYVRRANGWRIDESRARLLWSLVRPLNEETLVIDAVDG